MVGSQNGPSTLAIELSLYSTVHIGLKHLGNGKFHPLANTTFFVEKLWIIVQ